MWLFLLLLPAFSWGEAWVPAAQAKQAEGTVRDLSGPLWVYDGTLFAQGAQELVGGLLSANSLLTYNSGYAWGRYDGQLWQGRGWNVAARGGAWFDSPLWFGQLAPEIGYSQNLVFATGPDRTSGTIDLVQRFGDAPLTFLGWGQTFVGARWGQWSARLSTENLWVGPAYRNPIVWGTEAAGFPHLRVNLNKTETPWGTWEGMTLLGSLEASDQATHNDYDGHRAFWGLVLGYSPPFLPNLSLGASRTLISRWDQLSALDLTRLFLPVVPGGGDQTDQRFNLMWRFRFPSLGFEVYGEWARNDYTPSLDRVLLNPFHSEAWTAGLVQRVDLEAGHSLGFQFEFTNLTLPLEQINNRFGYGAGGDFYNHGLLREGYTNGGQLLGAPIGNGGNSQALTITWYHPQGEWSLGVERWHRDASYYYSQEFKDEHPGVNWETDVDMELSLSAGWVWRFEGWESYGQVIWMKNVNRYYIPGNDIYQVHLELGAKVTLDTNGAGR